MSATRSGYSVAYRYSDTLIRIAEFSRHLNSNYADKLELHTEYISNLLIIGKYLYYINLDYTQNLNKNGTRPIFLAGRSKPHPNFYETHTHPPATAYPLLLNASALVTKLLSYSFWFRVEKRMIRNRKKYSICWATRELRISQMYDAKPTATDHTFFLYIAL